jgi:hypothetical protein
MNEATKHVVKHVKRGQMDVGRMSKEKLGCGEDNSACFETLADIARTVVIHTTYYHH